MTQAYYASKELTTAFGWLLNAVSDTLTKNEGTKIARAEGIPESVACPESDCFRVTVLFALQSRGRYDPLHPDGLIEILDYLERKDVIEKVKKYKSSQRYKEESKKLKKSKQDPKGGTRCTCMPEDLQEEEKLLIIAKPKFYSLQNALIICDHIFSEFKRGKATKEEVKEASSKLKEILQKCGRTMQTYTSASSITSIASSEYDEENAYEELADLTTNPGPVQETHTETTSSSISTRFTKPLPLPRTKLPQQVTSIPVDSADFTGGSGDSGMGTGESNREEWIGDRKPPPVTQKPSKQAHQPAKPSVGPHYSPLLTRSRDEPTFYEERLRINISDSRTLHRAPPNLAELLKQHDQKIADARTCS